MSTRLKLIAVVLAALAGLLAPAGALAAPAAPAWSATLTAYPTIFAHKTTGDNGSPPGYLLVATDLGGAPTSGEFTIVDTLPSGLSFAISEGAYGSYGTQDIPLTCATSGQTLSCSGGEPALRPGETVHLNIPVKVAAGAFHSVRNEATIEGGGAAAVTAAVDTPVGIGFPAFGLLPGEAGLHGLISNADGSPATQAGSHPYQVSIGMGFPSRTGSGELFAVGGGVRDLTVELPRGMVVNPEAVGTRCIESQLQSQSGCPNDSQVGTLTLVLSPNRDPLTAPTLGLYRMAPPPGVAVEFGAELFEGAYAHMLARLRSDGNYGLSAGIDDISANSASPLLGAEVTLWGNPSDESHDAVRGSCLNGGGACPVDRTDTAFLTLPGSCGGPLATRVWADSWAEPWSLGKGSVASPAIDGCNGPEFEPSFFLQPSTDRADSPIGLSVRLHIPQENDFDGLAQANLRDATIVLPDGLTANLAAAGGLGACSAGEAGLSTEVGQTRLRFTAASATCPAAAKLGTVEIVSPLIDHPLRGAIYLAEPYENPFGSLLAIYLAIDDPQSGIVFKLPGRIEADPGSGRLSVHLEENPELPFEDVRLDFFDGPRSVLRTPVACGTYVAGSVLTPWSSPEGANAAPSDSFAILTTPASGARCPSSEAEAPNRPSFSAGALAPEAGAHSPFVLQLSRGDGSQRLAAVDATLPPGLSGRLAGVRSCSDAQVAAASCPAASEVGTVDVGAGAGSAPLHLSGRAYLAGPYKGAPLSLAVLTPAIAGPFDLGAVVVRVALFVDPRLAQIHAVSDPLPRILQGIPLDVRSLALALDRPNFTLNPTSCDPTSVAALVTSAVGQSVPLTNRFQVGDCARLGFKPRVAVRLLGPTHRGAHPKLRAALIARRGDANLSRAAITLPGTALLDSRRIRDVCDRAAFAADRCPGGSVYGHARAWTPLLDRPLEGPVYLRSGKGRLPDLVASMSGQVNLDLRARLDSARGRLRTTFSALPDVPLSKVVLTLDGGREGLLANTGGLCRGRPRADARLDGQNGKAHDASPAVMTDCPER
jgi:hypothetical protein